MKIVAINGSPRKNGNTAQVLEAVRREVEGAGGLVYSASVEGRSGRISVEPLGFAWDLFGEEPASHAAEAK